MKKRTLIVLLVMAVISALCFTACGGKETMTLEKYVKDNPDIQESIDSAMNDSNVVVEIKENDISYTFDLSKMDGYTEELAKSEEIVKALDEALGAAGSTFGGIAKTLEEKTEITGITTTVNYTWGDEQLVTKTFSSADADADADAGAEADEG